MSDLYDSLEEGSDENKRSCDSLDKIKAEASNSPRAAGKSQSMHHYPFYLNQNFIKDNLTSYPYFSSAFNKAPQNQCREKNFLPKIKNKFNVKDQDPVQKLVVDSQILSKQGLQLNNDGSFTKSPRPEAEELPFISREYRDLQFPRQKLKIPTKKTCPVKIPNKNLFSFTDNPVDGISMNAIISSRKKKGSSEELLMSESSESSTRSKSNKESRKTQNMTDSMKEKLLCRSPRDTKNYAKGFGNMKNVKHTMNILDGNSETKTSRLKQEGQDSPKFLPSERTRLKSDAGNEVEVLSKSIERKLSRFRSDYTVNAGKPKLNYSERRQLQNGYNPLHLRLGALVNKKVPGDTNRSNFGDSTVEELTGSSSRFQSTENIMDENEENYYRKLVEMDRNQRKKVARSSRSEGPIEFINLRDIGTNPQKAEKKKAIEVKLSAKGSPKAKKISKSLSVDMPYRIDNCNKYSKKNSHLCLGGTSMTWSKAELALKAKTYGYMVNARNIFKLKARSEGRGHSGKSSGRSGKSKSEKISPQPSQPPKGNIKKRISLPENALPKMRQESLACFRDFSKKKTSPMKVFADPTENQKSFVLPEVRNLTSRSVKTKMEMFGGISSSLKSPKH